MKSKKVIVVGLDGATWKVLGPLIKKGKMPFLASLRNKSSWGVLTSTLPPLTAPAWVSFQTGVNPGRHGIFGFTNKAGEVVSSKSIGFPRIWETLGDQGLKSLVINMPVSYPIAKTKGVLVSSMLTPEGADFAYPKRAQKRLAKLNYIVDYGKLPHKKLTKNKKNEIIKNLLSITQKRIEAFKVLFEKGNFNFSFLLIKETDVAQHLFWGEKRLEVFYQKLDGQIKDLYQFYKNEKNDFIIISDHGFHQISDSEFSVYKWLEEEKFIKISTTSNSKFIKAIYQKVKKLPGATSIRNKIIQESETKTLKRTTTKAYLGGLYLSPELKTQENQVIAKLRKLKYKNKAVFKNVFTSSTVYKGEFTGNGPDIVWEFNESYSLNRSTISKYVFNKRKTYLKGDHISDRSGIYLMHGNQFKNIKGTTLDIRDIHSLVCYLLEKQAPPRVEGFVPASNLKQYKDKLDSKIKNSEKIIRKAYKRFGNKTAMAFTGRKDSLVMTHLVLKTIGNKLPVFFIDHGLHFVKSLEFHKKISKKWKLKVYTEANRKIYKKILGEKSRSEKARLLTQLKIKTISESIKKHGWKAMMSAVRKDEHIARSKENYFSKRNDHWRVHPLLDFTEADIWEYIKDNKLEYNPLYDKGYRSIGDRLSSKKSSYLAKAERLGREKEKEQIMDRLRSLGYF